MKEEGAREEDKVHMPVEFSRSVEFLRDLIQKLLSIPGWSKLTYGCLNLQRSLEWDFSAGHVTVTPGFLFIEWTSPTLTVGQQEKKAFYWEKAIVQNSQHMLGGGRSACVWAVFRVYISDLTELSNFYCYPLECCFLFWPILIENCLYFQIWHARATLTASKRNKTKKTTKAPPL